jgi:pilus assembly protein TadC
MTIAGWEMSFSEFIGLLLLIAVLTIVLFIIAHEYAVWRRRRLARAIVPAKPEGGA